MSSLPSSSHDWAKWLLSNLADVEQMGDGLLKGRLPSEFDFNKVIASIELCSSNMLGMQSLATREIEFQPAAGHVYGSLEDLLKFPTNQQNVPEAFTLLDTGYSFPGEPVPLNVSKYVSAVELWKIMERLADHVSDAPKALHFIMSHDAKVQLVPQFSLSDADGIQGVAEFDRDYVRTDLHRDQKRNIVRSTLVDRFKSRRRITHGELLRELGAFLDTLKASYAMYAADFSYEKVRDEIEEQNLDDMLRLNKTLSDIQNQLLAVPAAMILAAASVGAGALLRNVAVLVGILIFAWLMLKLIANQRHSVEAISAEVNLRKRRIAEQPGTVSEKFISAFEKIDFRVSRQSRVLNGIRLAIVVVVAMVVAMVLVAQLLPSAIGGGQAGRDEHNTMILIEEQAQSLRR